MANDIIKVGLSGDWHYDTINRAYDLSRRSEKRVALPISHSKEAESVIIDPRKTALVIVDMQNAFLHPRCRDHPLGLETVQPIVKTITKCREVGIEVGFLITKHRLSHRDIVTRRSSLRRDAKLRLTKIADYLA